MPYLHSFIALRKFNFNFGYLFTTFKHLMHNFLSLSDRIFKRAEIIETAINDCFQSFKKNSYVILYVINPAYFLLRFYQFIHLCFLYDCRQSTTLKMYHEDFV